MKINLRSFGIAALLALLLACQPSTDPTAGKMIFRYNQASGLSSLDPAFARVQGNIWACRQLYNTLVDLNEDLLPVPSLAKSWQVQDSGRTYRFTLRHDVFFHDFNCGDNTIERLPLRAKDVKFSFSRLLDKDLASPGTWVMRPVEEIVVCNDSVLEIRLKKAFPPFLSMLSMAYCSVVPELAFTCENRDFGTNPVGTGAFQFQKWLWNEKLVFRKNPNYFERDEAGRPLPYIDAVSIRFLPEKQAEYLELLRGRIDMVSGLDPSYVDDAISPNGELNPRYRNELLMLKGPYLNTEYLGIYLGDLPDGPHDLQDAELRKAAHLAFDRQSMLTHLRKGVGEVAGRSIVPPSLPGSLKKEDGNSFNAAAARELIHAWKLRNQGRSPQIALYTSSAYLDLCEFVQAAWQSVGFEAKIELMPASSLREGMANGKLQVFRASWIADYPDAQNYLSLFFGPNQAPDGPNYTHFQSTTFDSLYVFTLRQNNDSLRYSCYRELGQLAAETHSVIPLFYDQAIRFVNRDWIGLEPNALNLLDLRRAYKRPNSATTGK